MDRKAAHFARVHGLKDHLERQPVGQRADDQPKHGEHDVLVAANLFKPELEQPENAAHPRAGVADERELLVAARDKHVDQQLLVLHHVGHDHVFNVKHVFNVVADLVHERFNVLRRFFLDLVHDLVLDALRQHAPQIGVVLHGHTLNHLRDRAKQDGLEFAHDLGRLEPRKHVLDLQQLGRHEFRGLARHLLALVGHDALPAQARVGAGDLEAPDKLERVKRHGQRRPNVHVREADADHGDGPVLEQLFGRQPGLLQRILEHRERQDHKQRKQKEEDGERQRRRLDDGREPRGFDLFRHDVAALVGRVLHRDKVGHDHCRRTAVVVVVGRRGDVRHAQQRKTQRRGERRRLQLRPSVGRQVDDVATREQAQLGRQPRKATGLKRFQPTFQLGRSPCFRVERRRGSHARGRHSGDGSQGTHPHTRAHTHTCGSAAVDRVGSAEGEGWLCTSLALLPPLFALGFWLSFSRTTFHD